MKNNKSEHSAIMIAVLLFHYSLQSHNFNGIQSMKCIVKNISFKIQCH